MNKTSSIKAESALSPLAAAVAQANLGSFTLTDDGALTLRNLRTLAGLAHVQISEGEAVKYMRDFFTANGIENDGELPFVVAEAESIQRLAVLGFRFPGADIYRAMAGVEQQRVNVAAINL